MYNLKHLKTFESYTDNNTDNNTYISEPLKFKTYKIQYWKNDSNIETVYNGYDYKDTQIEFESFETNDLDTDTKGEYDRRKNSYYITLEFQEKIDEYEWIGSRSESLSEDDPLDISDYPIEDFYDDDSYYRLVSEGDYDTIDDKEVETPYGVSIREEDEKEESIKNEVIGYIRSITSENKNAGYFGSTFYSLKEYLDGYIMIRVADHFFNIDNVNLGKEVLYDYIEGLPQHNSYKNIYGFISINILNRDSNDKKGFRSDLREWKEDNPVLKDLIDYIDIDLSSSEDYYMNWKEDLDDKIDELEYDIDIVLSNGIFDE